MINYKHKYRVIKSSWGIAIDIDGAVMSITDFKDKDNCKEIYPGIWWFCEMDPLSQGEASHWLLKGLEILYNDILKYSPYKDGTLIIIKSYWFNMCDFQEEGLVAAIIEWVAKALNFDLPHIDVSFCKDTNRYEYFFPETNQSQ